MSDLKLALTYLRARLLVTALTVFSVALGLGLAVVVLNLTNQAKERLNNESNYWDMVVGAKGSALQLVLSGIYYMDSPTGNVNIDVWHKLQHDPSVETVVPVNMGDNYYGEHIVGTVPEFFTGRQARAGAQLLAQGRMFSAPFETVIGADVARQFHLPLGQTFVGAHGWNKGSTDIHTEFPYTVVGVLASTGTSIDRAIFTDYRSVWRIHVHEAVEHHETGERPDQQVTVLLVRLRFHPAKLTYMRDVNMHWQAMAADPVDEINKVNGTFVEPLQNLLIVVAYLVVLVSALSILISLYLTIHQRRRDLAVLRSLGATQGNVFWLITLEAAMLSGLGVIIGWALGHGVLAALSPLIQAKFGISLDSWYIQWGELKTELTIMASVWGAGIVAGLLPAIIAYRLPVAETLLKD